MRLLEFNQDGGGANPRRPGPPESPPPKAPPVVTPAPARAARPDRPHRPIDLEQLQQRIGFLERRLQEQGRETGRLATSAALEQLREHVLRLEGNLHEGLNAAQRREDRLLEALDRPSLMARARDRLSRARHRNLPAVRRWLAGAARGWWDYHRPGWWPRFAAAWQEALDRARQ